MQVVTGRDATYVLDSNSVLGTGSFSTVYLGRNNVSNQNVAVKVISKGRLSKQMRERLAKELDIYSRLQHQNIASLIDTSETSDAYYLVMEYINGVDLFDYVISKGRLLEHETKTLFYQLCCALDHAHSRNVIHHDVKLENVLLQREGKRVTLKLVDFGLSVIAERGQLLSSFSGTEAYCAAEIINGRRYDGVLIDIYSAGVFLYICLTGSYPFSADLEVQAREQASRHYLSTLHYPEDVSAEARDLVLKMLEPVPVRRISAFRHVLQHAFFLKTANDENDDRNRDVETLEEEPTNSLVQEKGEDCGACICEEGQCHCEEESSCEEESGWEEPEWYEEIDLPSLKVGGGAMEWENSSSSSGDYLTFVS